MANPLVTTEWMSRMLLKRMEPELERLRKQEEMIRSFMDETGAPLEDLILEYSWSGVQVRRLTADEKWLRWHSDNHSWEQSRSND